MNIKVEKTTKKLIIMSCIISIFLCLVACGDSSPAIDSVENAEITDKEETLVAEEDLQVNDRAIVIHLDNEQKSIILQTVTSNERYEISYDGISEFYDKYMQALSPAQINPGDIVDVTVSVHSKTLKTMAVVDGFSKTGIDSYSINENKGMFSVGDDNFKINSNTPVFFGETIGKITDINENDVLAVKGIERNIYSITVESGHGYLRLTGEEYFQGGWVECGKVIKPISEGMLLLVPEGDYDMRVTYKGYGGTKPVHIERDKETLVDVSDLKGELLKSGMVSFSILPNDAILYINGEKTDYNIPIELEYGVYQLDITCEGYKSMRKYLSVGNENAAVSFSMEESDGTSNDEELPDTLSSSNENTDPNKIINLGEKTTSTSSSSSPIDPTAGKNNLGSSSLLSSSSSSNTPVDSMLHEENQRGEDVITTSAKVYIDSPEGVEVYYDGSYKGIAPISFNKDAGTHVITLRKDGYVTKSYTLTLGTGDNDETYSFNMLSPE